MEAVSGTASQLLFNKRGRASTMEASSPSPSGPLGDETVRSAKPASTPVASPPVSRSSSSWETGLAQHPLRLNGPKT